MFQVVHPDNTLARTKTRLDRHGPTLRVIAANVFDWVSLSLHQSLFYILAMTLGVALLGRAGLTLAQILLLFPLGFLLAVQPALRAGKATRRQLEMHRIARGVWKATDDEDTTLDR